MKHQIKITALIIAMFVLAQFIGLLVIDAYSPKTSEIVVNGTLANVTVANEVPYGMQPPKVEKPSEFGEMLIQFVIALVTAIFIFLLLMKIKAKSLLRLWFTAVVFITISLALTALMLKIFPSANIFITKGYLAMILAVPLTFYKIFKRDVIVHNATELLIYPGIAAIFVPLLNISTVLILLAAISIYDIWAVWKSSLMINMVRYEIQNVKVVPGFFIPYTSKQDALKLAKIEKMKAKKEKIRALKKIKISTALLGGGDVLFPLLFAGVMYTSAGLIPALMIVAGSALALSALFTFSKKGKMYPAMPYLTAGCVIGYLISLLI